MTEQFIMQYVPKRLQQLGYSNYHLRYHDLVVGAESKTEIPAWNDLYFIVDDPRGFVIESDYGLYDSTDNLLTDNVHQHRGAITVWNPTDESRRIKFIQVIIVN
jgi:hypothetical protein